MTEPCPKKYKTWTRLGTAILMVLFTLISGHLLYSAWCALTWGKFTLNDYGIYTNMIWDSGHANWFRYLVDNNYLSTHLSFSLALLDPLFYLWDNPFLLSLLQWLMMVSGAVFLALILKKSKSPFWAIAAVLIFIAGYKYTQSILLNQFHGVAVYMLLLPWLYYTCIYAKHISWLPLLLILGVREDAFLFVLPLLLYFAIQERWKGGYILFAIALTYGILAITVLYPAINGYSLLARRSRELSGMGEAFFAGKAGALRIHGILWTFLPILCFAGRRMLPVLLFPAAAIAQCLLSGYSTQQSLGGHYGSPTIICLAAGVTESLRMTLLHDRKVTKSMALSLGLLLIVTLCFHLHEGFIFMGGRNYDVYSSPSAKGQLALHIAKQLPKKGILLTENSLVGMCANRPNLMIWRRYNPEHYDISLIFANVSKPLNPENKYWLTQIGNGNFGIRYYDGIFIIIERGYDTTDNNLVLNKITNHFCPVVLTCKHGGIDNINEDGKLIRYWNGNGSKGPICLSYGHCIDLPAGTYEAVYRFSTLTPERNVRNSWGWLSVHHKDASEHIAKKMITPLPELDNQQREQRIRFELKKPAIVELRITGADAQLWLDSMWIE